MRRGEVTPQGYAHGLAHPGSEPLVCDHGTRETDLCRDRGHRRDRAGDSRRPGVAGASCDVSDEAAVRAFATVVRDRLGPVDVLVNNAGLAHFGPVAEMSVEDFDETMAVNVRGTFLMTRAFLPDMLERRDGHIINIASLAGRNPVPQAAAYSAAKHAVLGLSKSVFGEVRKQGVRVTAICPGSVVTPFFEKSGATIENPDAKLRPEDIAETVLAVLRLPPRALLSELDIRPSNP